MAERNDLHYPVYRAVNIETHMTPIRQLETLTSVQVKLGMRSQARIQEGRDMLISRFVLTR